MIRLVIEDILSKGYTIDGEMDDNWITLIHESHTPILIQEQNELIFLLSKYKLNERVKKDEIRLQRMLNKLNLKSAFAKFSLNFDPEQGPNTIIITTTWFDIYSKELFNNFLRIWQYENREMLFDVDGIEDFLLLTRKSKIVA